MAKILSRKLGHYNEVATWGSEANNDHACYGYWEHAKPRWEQISYEYHDMGALDKFGIDPRRPPGAGIIMSANSYGFPQMGYTTGYTTKLPAPANFEVASHTPVSSNTPSIIEASDGTNAVPSIPSDDPVEYINMWKYGDETQQRNADNVRSVQDKARLKRQAKVRGKSYGNSDESVRHVAPYRPHQQGNEMGDHRQQAQPARIAGPFVF